MKPKIFLVSLLLFLVACSSNSIPKGFDEEELNKQAKQVIEYLQDAKYEHVIDMMREDVQAMLPVETLQEVAEAKFAAVGSFEKYAQVVITDTTDPKTSEVYAVVIVVVEYTDGKGTYTLTFDKDLRCVGLYIK
jgi:hypothetical protein